MIIVWSKSQYKSIVILKLVFISLCFIALYWSIILMVLLCDSEISLQLMDYSDDN